MTSPPASGTSWVTMLTSDSFLIAAEVLIRSLRVHNTDDSRPVCVLVTPTVGLRARKSLERLGACLRTVEGIPAPGSATLPAREATGHATAASADATTAPGEATAAPRLGTSHVPGWDATGYTKLHLWNLTEFSKVVYIDCDCLVTAGVDELFARPGQPCPAAAPDVFPPDRFNAGVLVVEPNASVFADMLARTSSIPTYDGGDTGFLNAYFPGWYTAPAAYRLPFGYNAQRTLHWMTFERQPGYWESIRPLKIIHYSSRPKPWEEGGKHKGPLEWQWWEAYLAQRLLG